MRTPRSENTVTKAAIDRAAIERWESEGGSTLDLDQESTGVGHGAASRSAAVRSRRRSSRGRPTKSSSS